jgi:hypothetical protein
MSDNPLEQDPARDAEIEKRAYHLWEADGRPHGRHEEYWERASELVGMEHSAGAAQLPNPSTVPGADPSRVEPVEEAFLQDNLGECPDRLADQGETMSTPRKRSPARKPDTSPSPGAAGDADDKASAKPRKAPKQV